MATVRIYKVAELLGLSSQDAIDLLKQDTGIAVKSASSSIEEIVARQFVERHAKKRQIQLPHGPLFTDAPVAKKSAGKGAKAPEPPKPAAPVMRPRLVKAIRPAAATDAPVEAAVAVEPPPPAVAEPPPVEVEAPPPVVEPPVEERPVVEEVEAPAPAAAAPPPPPPAPPVSEPPAPPAPPIAARPAGGRLVPPTRRLRIEDPLTGEAPAARPLPQRPVVRPQPSPPAPTRPGVAPGAVRPAALRPVSPVSRAPLGGPRPLPSQPIRLRPNTTNAKLSSSRRSSGANAGRGSAAADHQAHHAG